jgi:hypothetical protein
LYSSVDPLQGSEDSTDATDDSVQQKVPDVARVDNNAVGADRFKHDESGDISELSKEMKDANAAIRANSNSTSNSTKNASNNATLK